MRGGDILSDVVSFNSAMSSCHWRRAIATMEPSISANAVTYASMVNACKEAWPCGLEMLKLMQRKDVALNVVVCGAAMSACEWELAAPLLEEMACQQVRRNVASLHAFEDWRMALGRLVDMEASLLFPGVISRNVIIDACKGAGKWKPSLCIVSEFYKSLVRLDVITYNSAMNACFKSGVWPQAVSLLPCMASEKISPDIISFSTAIAAVAACRGQWARAVALFSHTSPTAVSCSSVLAACASSGQWEVALSILSKRISPDVVCYNSVASACEKVGLWSAVLHLLEDMERLELTPTVITFSSAISACEKGKKWPLALQLLSKMIVLDVLPNVVTFGGAISVCEVAGRWLAALQLLKLMSKEAVRSNLTCCNSAISACTSARQWKAAIALLEVLELSDVIGFSSVLNALRGEQWQLAINIVKSMSARQVPPNAVSYSSLVECLEEAIVVGNDCVPSLRSFLDSLDQAATDDLSLRKLRRKEVSESLCLSERMPSSNKALQSQPQ